MKVFFFGFVFSLFVLRGAGKRKPVGLKKKNVGRKREDTGQVTYCVGENAHESRGDIYCLTHNLWSC